MPPRTKEEEEKAIADKKKGGPVEDTEGMVGTVRGKGSVYLVFEYLEHDLTGLLDSGYRFVLV